MERSAWRLVGMGDQQGLRRGCSASEGVDANLVAAEIHLRSDEAVTPIDGHREGVAEQVSGSLFNS